MPNRRLRSAEHASTSDYRDGVWWPKQPCMFAGVEAVERPVPVFGRYPKGFVAKIAQPALGVARPDILHVCSGSLREGLTLDIRREVAPRVVGNALALPFRTSSIPAVLCDPPYVPAWEKQYGTKYPPTYPLLREAVRVVRPGGRVGILHFLVPYTPKGSKLIMVQGIVVGMGYQIRAFTVYEKLGV